MLVERVSEIFLHNSQGCEQLFVNIFFKTHDDQLVTLTVWNTWARFFKNFLNIGDTVYCENFKRFPGTNANGLTQYRMVNNSKFFIDTRNE